MRFLAFSAMTVAFLATVSAKFNFGRCRTDIPQLTFDDIDAEYPCNGRLAFIDRGLESLIADLTAFGFKMPFDYECEGLGSIEPFKSIAERQKKEDEDLDDPTEYYDGSTFAWDADTEDTFNLWFPEREDAVLKLISYDVLPHAPWVLEQWYLCIDTYSLDAILEQNLAFGLERNSASSFFVSLLDVFKRLSMSFKVHGGLFWGMKAGSGDLVWNTIIPTTVETDGLEIPGYNFNEYIPVIGSDTYCDV